MQSLYLNDRLLLPELLNPDKTSVSFKLRQKTFVLCTCSVVGNKKLHFSFKAKKFGLVGMFILINVVFSHSFYATKKTLVVH